MNKRHSEVLEYINGSNKVVGIIPTLENGGLCSANYFIESNYKDTSGKANKCYLVTKMGGEFMDIKKKEALLKANLQIFDELNSEDINYVLGYVSGLVNAKKLLKKKHLN